MKLKLYYLLILLLVTCTNIIYNLIQSLLVVFIVFVKIMHINHVSVNIRYIQHVIKKK